MGNCSIKKDGDITPTNISKNNFKFLHVIGKGGYGKVICTSSYLSMLKGMVRLIQEKQKDVRHEGNVKGQSPHKEKCKFSNEREKTAINLAA